jgi:hypothetical protein
MMRVILEAFGRLRSEPIDLREPGPEGKIEYMFQLPTTRPSLTMKSKGEPPSTSMFWRCSFEHTGWGEEVDGIHCEIWTLTSMIQQ